MALFGADAHVGIKDEYSAPKSSIPERFKDTHGPRRAKYGETQWYY
jgi:hypothetical protein